MGETYRYSSLIVPDVILFCTFTHRALSLVELNRGQTGKKKF
jgi:hypothetical protein